MGSNPTLSANKKGPVFQALFCWRCRVCGRTDWVRQNRWERFLDARRAPAGRGSRWRVLRNPAILVVAAQLRRSAATRRTSGAAASYPTLFATLIFEAFLRPESLGSFPAANHREIRGFSRDESRRGRSLFFDPRSFRLARVEVIAHRLRLTSYNVLPYSNTLPEGNITDRSSHAASHPLN